MSIFEMWQPIEALIAELEVLEDYDAYFADCEDDATEWAEWED